MNGEELINELQKELYRNVPREPFVREYIQRLDNIGVTINEILQCKHLAGQIDSEQSFVEQWLRDDDKMYFYVRMFIDEYQANPDLFLTLYNFRINQLALSRNANPNYIWRDRYTPGRPILFYLTNAKMLRLFLAFGADPNPKISITPFVQLLLAEHLDLAEILLPHINITEPIWVDGKVANIIDHIFPTRRFEMVCHTIAWLLNRGAKPTDEALANAILKTNLGMVYILLDHGASIPGALAIVHHHNFKECFEGFEDHMRFASLRLIPMIERKLFIMKKYFGKWREFVRKRIADREAIMLHFETSPRGKLWFEARDNCMLRGMGE